MVTLPEKLSRATRAPAPCGLTQVGEDSPRRRASRENIRELLSAGAVAALSVSLYVRALGNPFVYDDRITVVENPSIRHLGDMYAVLRFDLFRPLVNLSFAFDYALWGLNHVGFHLTNMALHTLNVVLLFALLSRIVGDCRIWMGRAGEIDPRSARLIPLVASLLFAVHPMMTEAVGYVSARSDVLAGTFFLLAFLFMRRGLLSGHGRWTVLALVAFLLALASKEVSVMFPFVLLTYDRLVLRPSGLEGRRRFLKLHLPLIGAALLIGAARVVVFVVAEHAFAAQALRRMLRYLTLQFEAIWKYVQLLVLPFHQSIAHNVTGSVALSVLGAVALVAACVLAFRIRERMPLLSFGVAWFLLLMIPSSSAVPLQSPIAEHRVYLASIGLFLVVGTAFARLVQGLRDRPVGRRVLVYAAGVLVLGGLAALTVSRHVVWADPVALWREAAFNAPRWDTYTALGHALRDAGDCETAMVAYGIASRIEPERLLPLVARWVCLTNLGRGDEARELIERIRGADPEFKRLCQEIRALAPHLVSAQACVEELRPIFGPEARG